VDKNKLITIIIGILITLIGSLVSIAYVNIDNRIDKLDADFKFDKTNLITTDNIHNSRLCTLDDKKVDTQVLQNMISLQTMMIQSNEKRFEQLQTTIMKILSEKGK
jgi:hypothetical protein